MEFHPPTGAGFDEAIAALADAFTLRLRPEHAGERTYHDSFDGLLYADGLELYHERGEAVLARREDGTVRARAAMARPRRPLFVDGVPEGALRDALAPLLDVRALLVIARLRCHERALDVLDDEQKTVARLTLTAPVVLDADRGRIELALRLRAAGLRGYDAELGQVRATVLEKLYWSEAERPLADEALIAVGTEPGGVSSKPHVALSGEQPAAVAVTAVLRAQLAVIEANVPGALAELDTEFLHDLRVAVRRSRAVQRECHAVFETDGLVHFRAEFRWLQQATGDARDLDVYLLGFDDLRGLVSPALRDDLAPLRGVLQARHRRAHAAMGRALRCTRAAELLAGWRTFLVELEAGEGGAGAQRPIAEVAGTRIVKVYRRMVRMGRAIGPASPAEEYHELRKQGKELRYLLELFGAALYPSEVVKPLIKTLKALQDVLGRHQDREVQAATLRGLTDELARADGGPQALVAVGALIQRLGEDEVAARSEFADCFATFAAKDQRTLVRKTFR